MANNVVCLMSILIRAVGDLCLRLGALSCYEAEYEDYMLRCLPISQKKQTSGVCAQDITVVACNVGC